MSFTVVILILCSHIYKAASFPAPHPAQLFGRLQYGSREGDVIYKLSEPRPSLSERRAAQKLYTLFNILHGNVTVTYPLSIRPTPYVSRAPEQKSTVHCYKHLYSYFLVGLLKFV